MRLSPFQAGGRKKRKRGITMKTYIDKEYTTIAQSAKVRDDLKEFKARYTDGDLKHFFLRQTDTSKGYCSRVVEAVVTGFPGGYLYNDETRFCVSLILDSGNPGIPSDMMKICYYCNLDLEINTRDLQDGSGRKMYSVNVFSCAE